MSLWGQQMCWLNAAALRNMHDMLSTLAVFQVPIAPLNEYAPQNIVTMVFTAAVSHFPRSWSNALAPKNMEDMSVTWDVDQFPIARLNDSASENIEPLASRVSFTLCV